MDPGALVGGRLFQVAFVVNDLDAALDRYTELLGGAPWRCYTFSAALHRECEYRGAPTNFSSRLALNDASPQIELIEPQSGPSIHEDWLRERGEGFHHLGVIVESVHSTTEVMARAGFQAVQTGSGFGAGGDGAYAYFDTRERFGWMIEAVEPPEQMPGPDLVWTQRSES